MRVVDSAIRSLDQDLSLIDPHHLIRSLFKAENPLPKGTAEDAILSWLIALPTGVDPANAAKTLSRLPLPSDAVTGEAAKVKALLREITAFPAERLSQARRRRRGSH